MRYYTDINSYQETEKTAVTLGKFDSLHRGHQKLISRVRDCAEKEKLKSVVFAFDAAYKQGAQTASGRAGRLYDTVPLYEGNQGDGSGDIH